MSTQPAGPAAKAGTESSPKIERSTGFVSLDGKYIGKVWKQDAYLGGWWFAKDRRMTTSHTTRKAAVARLMLDRPGATR